MTVTEWCRYWHREIYEPKVRFSTWQSRGYVLETHIYAYFKDIEIDRLTQKDVREFLDKKSRGYSAAMVSNISKVLHLCLKAAVEQAVIPVNPADGLSSSSKAKCKTKPLTEFQLAEYLCAAQGTECEIMLRLIAEYGLRPKEVCGLRWTDINPRMGTLTINQMRGIEKGGLVDYGNELCREILVTKEMANQLSVTHKRHLSSEVLFIHKGTLKPYTPQMLRRRHKEILSKTSLPEFTLSDLHHSFALNLLQKGESAKEVTKVVGAYRPRALRSYYKEAVNKVAKARSGGIEMKTRGQDQTVELIENVLKCLKW